MNTFLDMLEKHDIASDEVLRRGRLTTLQVNMGNLCNQACRHCHIEASPEGRRIMDRRIVDDILKFLGRYRIEALDITGGAPELNPNFDYLIRNASDRVGEIIVRSNLTVLLEPDKKYMVEFFKKYNVHLICSLPCYREENVDGQRGRGVFAKSIEALRLLNAAGYPGRNRLKLDLVYNPQGPHLPPDPEELESSFRHNLTKDRGIDFNRLITITNAPIKRFRNQLESSGQYERYLVLLKDNFNPKVVDSLMCRNFLSVGHDGRVYDCDFNLALGWALKDKDGIPLAIAGLDPDDIESREIMVGEHCLSCTAGFGSSCQGALTESKQGLVKRYYGEVLKTKRDLKTSACCSIDSMPPGLQKIYDRNSKRSSSDPF